MNILVTGAKGMVGTALVNNLKNIRDGKNKTRPNLKIGEIYCYDLDSTKEDLEQYCQKADFVFNLAGVNRPQTPEEFMQNIISPSGGWKTAEHLLKLALYGKYNINGNVWGDISLYSAFGFNTYFNYCHKPGEIEFQPQLLIGAKYTY